MLEQKIFSHLSTTTSITALSGTRLYPVILPQNPTYPAITYQRVAGVRINSLSGYSTLENPVMQVDVWAKTYEEAISLSGAVITAMENSTSFKCTLPHTPIDIYEDEIEAYRREMDFSIWNNE